MPSLLRFMISLSDLQQYQAYHPIKVSGISDLSRTRKISASASDAEFLLRSLFRFCSQGQLTGQGIEDFRVPERPSIINRHSLEAPLVAIAH
jgi:hypothetical protein